MRRNSGTHSGPMPCFYSKPGFQLYAGNFFSETKSLWKAFRKGPGTAEPDPLTDSEGKGSPRISNADRRSGATSGNRQKYRRPGQFFRWKGILPISSKKPGGNLHTCGKTGKAPHPAAFHRFSGNFRTFETASTTSHIAK